MIYVGTSGYSYNDWVGYFYSAGIKKGEMLKEYAKAFKFTEINSTYYAIPNKLVFLNLVEKTPEDFKFTVKLHSSMTHTRDAGGKEYSSFKDAISPAKECKRLGCVVAQFPYSFHYDKKNLDYIKKLKDNFIDIPLCVEFRNSGWSTSETYRQLSMEDIGYVCVDEPNIDGLLRQTSVVTSRVGYVRFHGRNSSKWYDHKEAYERYDYLYGEDTLKEWVPRINFINQNTNVMFIAFNNHFRAQGAVNARMLQELLDDTSER